MLQVLLVFLISSSFSFAQEQQQLTKNPVLIAVAKACGDKVYAPKIESEDVDEIMGCYQAAMSDIPRYRSTHHGMANIICDSFKKSDVRKLKCLHEFQKVVKDEDLGKFLKSCPTQEQNMSKCLIAQKSSCNEQTQSMIACLNKEKESGKFPKENGSTYALKATEERYVKNVQVGCGDFKAIGSTAPTAEEVEAQVNCYQMGLIMWEKKTRPTAPKLSLDICSQFKFYSQKASCVRRIAEETRATDLKEAVKSNKSAQEQLSSINPMAKIVDDCFIPKGKKKSFKDPEEHYQKAMECAEREFGKASNFTPDAAAAASGAASGAGSR